MINLALSALRELVVPASTWSNQLPAYHTPALPSFLGIRVGEKATAVNAKFGAGRDGSSISNAIVITALTETDGIMTEHDHFAKQACANGGTWAWTKQALRMAGSLKYDQIDTKCSSSDDVRSFFFDVTSFYEKLGD